jgi:hypothetical protein
MNYCYYIMKYFPWFFNHEWRKRRVFELWLDFAIKLSTDLVSDINHHYLNEYEDEIVSVSANNAI